MPLASPLSKASMSLEELVACEDLLDGHREYATELLSDIEAIRRWHPAESCPGTRDGQPCTLCEMCDDNGLLGTTKSVLENYEDADGYLKQVRASLNASGRGGSSPHTLFTSAMAKAVFLGVVTVGETLRSQHAAWSVRLQSVVANVSAPSPPHVRAGSGDTDKNGGGNARSPAYAEPAANWSEANSKLSAFAPGLVLEPTPSSPMFLVFRRCLTDDCCCDAGGSHDAQSVSPPPLVSKTPRSKTTQSLATKPPDRCKKASDAVTQPSADAQTRAFDTPSLQSVISGVHKPSGPASDAAMSTQETKTFSPSPKYGELIVDPRVFHLRPELVRFNVARRALMDWCRARLVELRLDPLERYETGPTDESIIRGTHGCSSASSLDAERVEPERSRHTTGKVGEATTKKLSHSDDDATAQGIQFNSQEELKERWTKAQRKRSKRQEKRFSSRLEVSK